MFERIKCYKSLRRHYKFVRGVRVLGILTNDVSMIEQANETLKMMDIIKKQLWFNRKLAVRYNQAVLKYGLSIKLEL